MPEGISFEQYLLYQYPIQPSMGQLYKLLNQHKHPLPTIPIITCHPRTPTIICHGHISKITKDMQVE